MHTPSLFDLIPDPFDASWRPDPLPQIASKGIRLIAFDTETSGLRWWEKDRPLGISVAYEGFSCYLPWGHRGGNLPEDQVLQWARRELRGVHLIGANIKFDIHHMREWGVDLESQGCSASDVLHYAALLDDSKKKVNLETLSQELLGEGKEVGLDKTRMAQYHASQVAEYAKKDAVLTWRLHHVMLPMLEEQDLMRVYRLENAVIWPVAEMERNGAPIDQELLERWINESRHEYERALMDLTKMAGFQVDPGRKETLSRLFQKYGIPITYLAAKPGKRANPSFTKEIIKGYTVDHPALKLLQRANEIALLRSNYLIKYQKNLDSHGRLRYALHQVRVDTDEHDDSGHGGTVTGRFTSGAVIGKPVPFGVNIQQVKKTAKQRLEAGYEEDDASHDDELYIIRKLLIPPKDHVWMSADAMQIEYRIFASYAGTPKVLEAYRKDPRMSFHRFMHELLRPYASLTYRQQKDLNFAFLYGAGMLKQSLMLGHISKAEYNQFRRKKDYRNPKLKQTKEVRRIYNREVPEVKELLARASHIAKPECDDDCTSDDELVKQMHREEKHRGFVCTTLGRRSRFGAHERRYYKAFNSVDQGSAADIAKQKTVEVHAERRETGLTLLFPVHDELDGYMPEDGAEKRKKLISEILDSQSFPDLRVPILWDVSTGKSWADCG